MYNTDYDDTITITVVLRCDNTLLMIPQTEVDHMLYKIFVVCVFSFLCYTVATW